MNVYALPRVEHHHGFGDPYEELVVDFVTWEEQEGIRNLSDSCTEDEWHRSLVHLTISAFTRGTSQPQHVPDTLGWSVEYVPGHIGIRLNFAERLVRVLRKVEKGLVRLREEFGPPESFGTYAVRVCRVLGVKGWIQVHSRPTCTYSDWTYRIADLSELPVYLNRMATEGEAQAA